MSHDLIDGRYRLEERIATGGMAEVWAAHDLELDRRVALKLLQRSADPIRFSREARAAAGLSHPNICRLYDFGDADGRPFIVLEHLPGGSLEDRLSSGEPLPSDEAARIASDIASGLAHAHARGLVHRDVKPGNVLFDLEGRAKVADFGIAHVEDASTLTEAGTLLGTAAYISPEQASGSRATPASDVYSFGVILYRMLTGRLPFEGESPLELAAKHANEAPAPILSLRPDALPELERVATAALAKRPEDRPADGAALLSALEGATDAEAATAVLAPPRRPPDERADEIRAPPRMRARPLAIGAALAALAAVGAGAALLASTGGSDGTATEPMPLRSGFTGATTNAATAEGTTEREATHPPATREGPVSRPTTSPPETSATPPPAPSATVTTPVTTLETTIPPATTAPSLPTTTDGVPTAPPPTEVTTSP
jgi:serine/threonine protein kinase